MINIFKYLKKPFIWFRGLNRIKKIIVILLILGASYFSYQKIDEANTSPTYKFATVTKGNIQNTVSETGEITATSRTEVTSTIQGIVEEVYVNNGDYVERGQELFYVTSSATQAEQTSAWSSYLSAQNSLESAKTAQVTAQASLEEARIAILNQSDTVDTMNENLADGNFDEYTQNEIDVTNSEFYVDGLNFDVKEQNYLNAEKTIEAAQVKLSSAWLAYQATIDGPVTAPVSGVVSNIAIAPGQNVDVSTSDTSAANAMMIKSNDQTWIKITVNEMEITDVAVGQNAQVSIDALDDQTFDAQVERIDAIGTNDGGIVTFGVYLLVDSQDNTIRPGMTAQVDIIIEEKNNILVVANSAIKTYMGENAVQILDEETGEVIYLPVEIGSSDDINTEIVNGVEEGQQIVLSSSTSSSDSESSQQGGGMMMPGMGGGPR